MKYLMFILAILFPAVSSAGNIFVEQADSVTCKIRANLLEYNEKDMHSIYEDIFHCKKKFDLMSNRKMTLEILSAEENSVTFRTVDPNSNDLDNLIMEARKIYGEILR